MVINSNHDIVGSVSGGCIENFVFAKSLEVIKNEIFQVLEFGVTNDQAWEVGLTCGGKIKVLVEKFSKSDLGAIKKINEIFKNEGKLVLLTNLSNGKRKVIDNFSRKNSFESKIYNHDVSKIDMLKETAGFVKFSPLNTKIIIIGAVHISESLVNIANILNFKVYLIDPRNNFDKKKFANKAILLSEWPDEGLKKININNKTFIVTLTHDPKLDDPAIIYSLKNNPLYIGCLGSKRTHEERIKRLSKKGFTNKELQKKIHAPIGLDIKASNPSEIACAIIAQIISRKIIMKFKLYLQKMQRILF